MFHEANMNTANESHHRHITCISDAESPRLPGLPRHPAHASLPHPYAHNMGQSGGQDRRPCAAVCWARPCRTATGVEVLDAVWLCVGGWVCVCGCVLGGLRICFVC